MIDRYDRMSRRDALRLGIGLGLGLAAARVPLFAAAPASAPGARRSDPITKPIPSSGERIPIVGIGTARRYDVGSSEAERAPLGEVLRNLPRLGGRLVDTAPSYGAAETVIGDLVAEIGNRHDLFLATKVGAGRRGVEEGLAEMRGSLERLRTDRIDLLQVHNLSGVYEMLPVLREWKREGQIRYMGVTTSSERQYGAMIEVMEREEMDFIQVDYAIDNRSAEDRILPLAADRGMAVLVNLPFGRGRVFRAFGDRPVPDWAAELGIASWAQFALKYVVSHPAVTCVIPGTAKMEYLEDNLGAARGELPDPPTRRRMADLVDSA